MFLKVRKPTFLKYRFMLAICNKLKMYFVKHFSLLVRMSVFISGIITAGVHSLWFSSTRHYAPLWRPERAASGPTLPTQRSIFTSPVWRSTIEAMKRLCYAVHLGNRNSRWSGTMTSILGPSGAQSAWRRRSGGFCSVNKEEMNYMH